jgi:hypothetical protein
MTKDERVKVMVQLIDRLLQCDMATDPEDRVYWSPTEELGIKIGREITGKLNRSLVVMAAHDLLLEIEMITEGMEETAKSLMPHYSP